MQMPLISKNRILLRGVMVAWGNTTIKVITVVSAFPKGMHELK